MNEIRAKMQGTTVVQTFNQACTDQCVGGSLPFLRSREGIKRRGPFLGTFLGKLQIPAIAPGQKGTKAYLKALINVVD